MTIYSSINTGDSSSSSAAAPPAFRALLISTNRETNPQPVYPLGLEYIRQACEAGGIKTELVDCNFLSSESDLMPLCTAAQSFRPDVVLISLRNVDSIESQNVKFYVPFAAAVVSRMQTLFSGRVPVVIGGSGFSLFPAELLCESGADYGIQGPGEHVIVELVRNLVLSKDPTALPGLVYREDERIKVNPLAGYAPALSPRGRSPELLKAYWDRGGLVNVRLKRGCPLRCIYCTYPGLGGSQVVRRDVAETVEEIAQIASVHGMDQFFMVDDVFNIPPNTPDLFAEEILRRGLKISWTGFFTPRGVTEERVALWKASGLNSIEFGIDTLSEPLLEVYRKEFSIEEVYRACSSCRSEAIPYSLFLIFGGPGETITTLEESIAHCSKLAGGVFFALLGMRIYPGTALCDLALNEGYIRHKQDLLKPVFYLSPKLDQERFYARMAELGRLPQWFISGFGLAQREELAARLRNKGAKGSLWEQALAFIS